MSKKTRDGRPPGGLKGKGRPRIHNKTGRRTGEKLRIDMRWAKPVSPSSGQEGDPVAKEES